MDILNYHWFRLVVDYDVERQLSLMRSARALARNLVQNPSPPRWWKPAAATAGALGVLTAAVGMIALIWKRREMPERRLRRIFAGKMRRHGYELLPWEGLKEFALRIESEEMRRRALQFIGPFNEAVYRKGVLDVTTIRYLKKVLRGL
jgi:hypothetical protein